MANRAVIVFLRAPVKGQVKTRLARFLNDAFVLSLYKAFVEDTLAAVKSQGKPYLFFWPPHQKTLLCSWLGDQYHYFPQQGETIGQKMAAAFKAVFSKNTDQAILIGTDIPQLGPEIISSAFHLLEKNGTVIGPSLDGGYYLIGFKKHCFSEMVFKGIDWSTPGVMDQTLAAMNRNLPVPLIPVFLPYLNDIDTPEDLEILTQNVRQGSVVGPKTYHLLCSYET